MHDSTYIRYVEQSNSERKSRMMIARAVGRGVGSYCLMYTEFQFGKVKGSLSAEHYLEGDGVSFHLIFDLGTNYQNTCVLTTERNF